MHVEDVFSLQAFGRYRRLANEKGYCDPFVPYVGPDYGRERLPRFVYCGVAARWDEMISQDADDVASYESEVGWTKDFIRKGMNGSPFWNLFDDVLAILDPQDSLTREERRRTAVWTNLSKLGLPDKATAPPDNDLALRALDVEQMRREIEVLAPDLLLCVSGSKLVPTGNDAFTGLASVDFEPAHERDRVKRLPGGGWLYWTMHPQWKPREQIEAVMSDLRRIVGQL